MMMQRSISVDDGLTIRVGRRGFLTGSCAVGLMATTSLARTAAAVTFDAAPVCALHNDQPYMDSSGRAGAYHPPAGTRSGDAVADLDDYTLRCAHYYL